MIVGIIILIAGFSLVLGKVPFAKTAGRVACGVVLIVAALPCLVGTLANSSSGSVGVGASGSLISALIVLLIVVVFVVIGRWSFKRWLASKPEPPVPTSSRRRVDLPELPARWSHDRYKEDDL
jgi:hypothetical protein